MKEFFIRPDKRTSRPTPEEPVFSVHKLLDRANDYTQVTDTYYGKDAKPRAYGLNQEGKKELDAYSAYLENADKPLQTILKEYKQLSQRRFLRQKVATLPEKAIYKSLDGVIAARLRYRVLDTLNLDDTQREAFHANLVAKAKEQGKTVMDIYREEAEKLAPTETAIEAPQPTPRRVKHRSPRRTFLRSAATLAGVFAIDAATGGHGMKSIISESPSSSPLAPTAITTPDTRPTDAFPTWTPSVAKTSEPATATQVATTDSSPAEPTPVASTAEAIPDVLVTPTPPAEISGYDGRWVGNIKLGRIGEKGPETKLVAANKPDVFFRPQLPANPEEAHEINKPSSDVNSVTDFNGIPFIEVHTGQEGEELYPAEERRRAEIRGVAGHEARNLKLQNLVGTTETLTQDGRETPLEVIAAVRMSPTDAEDYYVARETQPELTLINFLAERYPDYIPEEIRSYAMYEGTYFGLQYCDFAASEEEKATMHTVGNGMFAYDEAHQPKIFTVYKVKK